MILNLRSDLIAKVSIGRLVDVQMADWPDSCIHHDVLAMAPGSVRRTHPSQLSMCHGGISNVSNHKQVVESERKEKEFDFLQRMACDPEESKMFRISNAFAGHTLEANPHRENKFCVHVEAHQTKLVQKFGFLQRSRLDA
eukprot:SAG11_NODE_3066_length_2715_cov_1.813838_4_plen_140_part_00